MRPDAMRHLCLAAVLAFSAGCASTGPAASPGADAAAASHSAMTNKGLANLSLAQNYLASGQTEYAMDRANRALRSDPSDRVWTTTRRFGSDLSRAEIRRQAALFALTLLLPESDALA